MVMTFLKSLLSSPWVSLLLQPRKLLSLFLGVLWTQILPILALISFPVYILAAVCVRFLPNYGKFLSYADTWMEEDFVTSIPRSVIVTTLALEGDISLKELRSLFESNVLKAKSTKNPSRIRYPELKQHIVTFMGFRIWKNDTNFKIENHIVDKTSYWKNRHVNSSDKLLNRIHEELMNMPFEKQRSPWEISRIRIFDDGNRSSMKTLLACRVHHVLADAKSLLKLFVECLGNKALKTANPHDVPQSWINKITYYPLFIPNHYKHAASMVFALGKNHLHPWKTPEYWKDRNVKTHIAFSPKLQLAEIKNVAKRNEATSSAVIMAIITGAIRKCGKQIRKIEICAGYSLPKAGHPETFANHLYMGFVKLPTNQLDAKKRLRQCNDDFTKIRASQQAKYLNFGTILGGSQIFPLTRLAVNQFTPMGLTNIAGEQDGFSVGKEKVIDFRMSVGVMGGVAGIVICAFSYTDGIRISVNAKENILSREDVEKVALDIGQELKLLTTISNCK